MLQPLQDYQSEFSAFENQGRFPDEAAVLLILTDDTQDPDIILTQRAAHLSQHPGEVSFPGGKWEESDISLATTALRETHEEIGLPPASIRLLNQEPPTLNRTGMKVTPFVGVISHNSQFQPCPDEIDCVFRVPVSFFAKDKRIRTDFYTLDGEELWSPSYHFGEYEIWGLTARILVSFLNNVLDVGIIRENNAPVKIRPMTSASRKSENKR